MTPVILYFCERCQHPELEKACSECKKDDATVIFDSQYGALLAIEREAETLEDEGRLERAERLRRALEIISQSEPEKPSSTIIGETA